MKPKHYISKNEWLFFSKLWIITDSIKGGFFWQNQTNPIQNKYSLDNKSPNNKIPQPFKKKFPKYRLERHRKFTGTTIRIGGAERGRC